MSDRNGFWKLFGFSGMVTLFNVLRGFVINKLLAVFLGPAAFACVGQFINLMGIGQATSSLALQNGWTSLTAQNKGDEARLLGIWRGGYRLTVFASILTCIVAVFFCFFAPIESILPGIPRRLAQAAILFALPGMLATNVITISAAVMNGLENYRRWATINIVAALWQMLWVAFFLFTGRLSVLSVVATQSVFAGVFAALYVRRAGFSMNRLRQSVLEIRGPWKSYALMGLVPMILTPIVLTFIRSTIGNTPALGWDAAGIWQGIWKISDFFASVISAILTVIILPKVSRQMTREKFYEMFNPLLLRIFLIALVVVVGLYFARPLVVSVMLSSNFSGAASYMPIQLVGDFFRAGGWTMGLVLIARQETKIFLIAEIASALFLGLGSLVGIRLFAFSGPMIAYAVENFLYFVGLYIVVRRLKWNIP